MERFLAEFMTLDKKVHNWDLVTRCTTLEHALRARSLRHTLMLGHMHFVGSESRHVIHVHVRLSLSSPLSLSTSICPSPSSPSSSFSCIPRCTLRSTTWSPCRICAPPRRGVTTPTTSPHPSKVMSLTTWSSTSSTIPRVPSPTLPRHRTWTWTTLHSASCSQRHTENMPITAIQKACQSVSRRRLLCSIEQGNLWEKEISVNWFWCHEKHVQCSQQVFWNTQVDKLVDRPGKLEERNSSNAQIRTLLDEQRQMIIAEYRDKIGHHELQVVHAEEERWILQEELWRQQMEFREVHQQSLLRWSNYEKFQSSTFDTFARRKLIEDHNTVLELSGRVQELQNEVNCMNDSKDFQDAASVRSGNYHVTSRPVFFPTHPILEGLLRHSFVSPRRKEGPPSIWDTHGLPGNVFANPPASSSALYPQELNPWRTTIEEPFHMSTAEKSERPEQNRDLRCQSGPSAKDSVIFSGGDSS